LRDFERTLNAQQSVSPTLLRSLVRAWDNEAWSAQPDLLDCILEWFPRTSGAVVECGSGLSTLLLATLGTVYTRRVYSLEHSEPWAARVRGALPARVAGSLDLITAPLESYGSFEWYARGSWQGIEGIGLAICDGPPGTTPGGRYGMGPLLKSRLRSGCIVVLDDTHRPEEAAIIDRWCRELPATIVQKRQTSTIIKVA